MDEETWSGATTPTPRERPPPQAIGPALKRSAWGLGEGDQRGNPRVPTGLPRGALLAGSFVSLLAVNLLLDTLGHLVDQPVNLATGCLVGLSLDLGDFLVYQLAMVLRLMLNVCEVWQTATLAPPDLAQRFSEGDWRPR